MLSEAGYRPRRQFLQALGASLVFRPNVLILHSDDQRVDTIRAWGNPQIDTPNVDRLVGRGVSFRQCYNQGGTQGAVCIASRAMLLSGKSLWRASTNSTLLPERFAEAGYETFFTGKWHLGREAMQRSFQRGGWTMVGGMGPHEHPKLSQFGSSTVEILEQRVSAAFADSLIGYLKQRTKGRKPFFGYCAFTAPHDPREATPEDLKRYESRELMLPRPWAPAPLRDNGELQVRDEVVVPAPRTREQCLKELRAYYALVTEMDRHIGRILTALEASGEMSNTIVVFCGDNGLAMGAHGLMGKQSMYEHSLRVPLVVSGPGFARRQDSKPMYLYELYHRLMAATGLSTPAGVEAPGAPLYFGYRTFQRAVRVGTRKMSWSTNTSELYDLSADSHEEHNLLDGPARWDLTPFVNAWKRRREHFEDPVAVWA